MPTFLSQLFDLPKQVRQGDFVLKLTDGVQHPDATLRDYVVTEKLAAAFDRALSLIQAAVEGHNSKGSYLHGSFGSGKSHFMAVLNLLLEHHPAAWARPELAAVLGRHGWARDRKFLLVPYHMIGARDMASAILGGYVDRVAREHPNHPHPGVYKAEGILADARNLRARMGDAAFFEALAQGDSGGEAARDDGWGTLAEAWNAGTFDAAASAPPSDPRRSRLVGDLVQAFFKAARETGEFVDLDAGLSIISHHAKDLGYDGVILFLDELILWLAGYAANPGFVTRQGQLVSKLVEAQNADRPIPLVSFIARQRDLRELVGENMLGNEYVAFNNAMQWWEERFDVLKLDDRDLATIAQKRVLKVRGEAARIQLDQAFQETSKIRKEVLEVLLTSHGNADQFHQTYPFSPALMETLVALSALLQRERTALKIMFQLLVEQQDRLVLGDIVPVGDLFEVLLTDGQPLSSAMQEHFEQARRLYRQKFLPLIQDEHGLTKDEAAQMPVDDRRAVAFRRDDRLAKTLLLSALAPEVESFKGMTVHRLAALNHGTIRTPIPGKEGQLVFNTLRKWGASIGQIRLGDEPTNQTVSIQLAAVDLDSVLRGAAVENNTGNQIRKVKELVYEMMGFPQSDDLWITHSFVWRATKRQCQILFANAREATDETFLNPGAEWRLIIDFPFDPEVGKSPRDDLNRLNEFRTRHPAGARTIVWLPSFLNKAAQNELGNLVLHDHVLTGNRLDTYASHLSAVDRAQARSLLENQRSALRNRVRTYLEAAYGIHSDRSTVDRDMALEVEEQIVSLDSALVPAVPAAGTLRQAAEQVLDRALASQFPAHPQFEPNVKTSGAAVKRVLAELEKAVQSPDGRLALDPSVRTEVRQLVIPLKLASVGETHMVLSNDWKQHFAQKEAQYGGPVTVAKLRRWMDEPNPLGLPEELQDLIFLTFARQTDRTFVLYGAPVPGALGQLRPEMEVREQRLPSEEVWKTACERAAAIFGLAPGMVRNATNVSRLAAEVKAQVEQGWGALDALARALRERMPWAGVDLKTAARSQVTAEAHGLLAALNAATPANLLDVFATHPLSGGLQAIGTTLKSAPQVTDALSQTKWEILEGIRHLSDERQTAAAGILHQLTAALTRDQLQENLAAALRRLESDATRLLLPPIRRPAEDGRGSAGGAAAPGGSSSGFGPPASQALSPASGPRPAVPGAPASSPLPLKWSPNDEAEIVAFYGGDAAALDRNRRLVESLKTLYGRSQASGDLGPSGIGDDFLARVLEVHQIVPLSQGGADAWSNMVVLSPTLHALLHSDPQATLDLAARRMVVFGVALTLEVHPKHLAP